MGRRKKGSSFGLSAVIALLIGGFLYIYQSSSFERESPIIDMPNDGYWNLKNPLEVSINDEIGVKSYKVTLKTPTEESILFHEQLLSPNSLVKIKVEPPKSVLTMKESDIKVIIEATDASKWNFFAGNSSKSEYALRVDKKRPIVTTISNSYKIKKGGVALVIFKAEDENIKELYVSTNFGKKFAAQPFYKEGHYIALLAWPIKEETFRATIYVADKAGNVAQASVPLYLQDSSYRVSNIKLTDDFLKGKIAELAEEFDETQGVNDDIERFKIINEIVREKNEKLIYDITSKVPQEMISDFKINKMYPLRNGAVVATFGDHRIYSYNDKIVSESYHMGLDLASNAMAEIRPQNGGEIMYAGYNGLYGNMPILHHGLGLYTLFGHCSSLNVNVGDNIVSGFHLANTGKSGYAMGDHLHFGILVQGIEVRPDEWMDESWIKLNITNIIDNAKTVIK